MTAAGAAETLPPARDPGSQAELGGGSGHHPHDGAEVMASGLGLPLTHCRHESFFLQKWIRMYVAHRSGV